MYKRQAWRDPVRRRRLARTRPADPGRHGRGRVATRGGLGRPAGGLRRRADHPAPGDRAAAAGQCRGAVGALRRGLGRRRRGRGVRRPQVGGTGLHRPGDGLGLGRGLGFGLGLGIGLRFGLVSGARGPALHSDQGWRTRRGGTRGHRRGAVRDPGVAGG